MSFLIREVVSPLLRRMGSILGTFLAAQGVAENEISAITGGLMALLGVVIDLGASHFERRGR